MIHEILLVSVLQNQNDTTILSGWRKVAFVENFYTVISEVHVPSVPCTS